MCQNDAHLFVRPDQIKDQFKEDNFQDYCFKILEMMISRSSYYFEKLPLI